MKPRILLPLLLLLLFPDARSIAQQTVDPKQAALAAYAHFKALTPAELNELLSKAQSGDAEAQFWVGSIYAEGTKPKNLEEGARWLLKSAEQGYAPAQRVYGLMSRLANPSVGERWMLRAAEQGDTEAQFWLGVAYEQNWFGTIDHQESLKWYKRAAEGGDPDAQAAEHVPDLGGAGQGRNRLGLLYMEGLGVPLDYVQAYFWFSLNGPEGNTTEAKTHLSLAQIREADRLVEEWKEQHRVSPEVAAAFQIEN